nr:atrial natriuretic peptide receptor 3-like [Halyomorpha halys]
MVLNLSDAFLGPVCDYVIAPVSRYSGVWGKPVITAGAQADHFFHKQEYPTLTRVMGSYRAVSIAMRHILNYFNWKIAGLLYFDYGATSSKGHSKCYLMLGPVFNSLGASSTHKSFNDSATVEQFKELLIYIAKSARIVVVCADPPVVREILLVAEELNMIDSGEYVFFNIELFNKYSFYMSD